MALTVKQKLKFINLLCQVYAFLFSFLTVMLFIQITLPAVTDGDHERLHHLTLVMYFILFNIWGNYFCVWYKSQLSFVKPESSRLTLDSLCSHHSIIFSPKKLTLLSPITTSVDIDNNNYNSWNNCSQIQENWMKIDTHTDKEYNKCLTFADSFIKNQSLNCQFSDVTSSNSSNSYLGLTYSSKFDMYSSDFSPKNVQKDSNDESADIESVMASKAAKESVLMIAGWTKCKDCIIIVPPRAKHCPLCGHCVLKRDHHCFFMGCCVGFHNQRFFIIFCLYAAVGGIYSSVITLVYLQNNFEALYTWGYLVYLFPVVLYTWFMGITSGFTVVMVIYLYWAIITGLICCYYFIVHIFLIYRGQTKYEYLKGFKTYQGPVWKHLISVFGTYWPIGFIIPAPFLGYYHDGLDWTELIGDNKLI